MWSFPGLLGREVFAGVFKNGKNSSKQHLSMSLANTFSPLVTEITLKFLLKHELNSGLICLIVISDFSCTDV